MAKLTIRIWPEDDGWHVDTQGAEPPTDEGPFATERDVRGAIRSMRNMIAGARIEKFDARPENADD